MVKAVEVVLDTVAVVMDAGGIGLSPSFHLTLNQHFATVFGLDPGWSPPHSQHC